MRTTVRRTLILCATTVLVGALAAASPAHAGPGHGCHAGILETGSDTPAAGSTVRVTGGGFAPNASPVVLRWGGADGAVLATAAVDERGSFLRPVTIPADARGVHLITARQRVAGGKFFTPGGVTETSFGVEVLAPGAANAGRPVSPPPGQVNTAPSSGLGWTLLPLALFALAVVGIGGFGLYELRQRRVKSPVG